MKRISVVVKLKDGMYQITPLNLHETTVDGVKMPFTLGNCPVFGPDGSVIRTCLAKFYRQGHNTKKWMYEEVETI